MHPDLAAAMQALQDKDLAKAETLVRARLTQRPEDAQALRLLAHIAAATGFVADAEQLLRRAVAIEPASVEAHADLASLLCRLERAGDAIAVLDRAAVDQPDAIWPLSLKAAIFDAERRPEYSLALHQEIVSRASHAATPWLNYGHVLQAIGRLDEAVDAYKRSLQIDPASGYAWWGLANLRTVRLGADEIMRLERALSSQGDKLQRVQLHFALGKALGDQGRFEQSFHQYEQANRLREDLVPYDASATSELVRQVETVFTTEFLAQRAGQGCSAPDPIFIVGMPRSGSTLVEQILASHPMVEGCGELFELPNVAAHLVGASAPQSGWPEAVGELGEDELQALGRRYLAAARRHRRTDRPRFTDKMPSNWRQIGLIHLMLPEAKVIDVRRDPLACCLSTFATYFNGQTSVPTRLKDLGRYYADYVRMVAHFEAVLPGRIHRLRYEDLLVDLEREVRRLLDYLGLPFDAACLRFHENPRPVHTPSAQQVRRPLNGDGRDRWRDYEPWLAPLKDALATAVIA